jgi:hypothetical protein
VLSAVGGLTFPPRRARVERLLGELVGEGQPVFTLGRCQIAVAGGRIDFYRERRNAPEPVAHQAGESLIWDRRFDVVFGAKPRQAGRDLVLRALDLGDWEAIQADCPALGQARNLPQPALWGLPVLADGHGVFSVPHLQYLRGQDWPETAGGIGKDGGFGRVRFSPAAAASAAGFQVV